MKAQRLSLVRFFLACLCFAGWTFATNQCALGLPFFATVEERLEGDCGACSGGCLDEQKPSDQGPNSAACLERCGELRLSLPPADSGLQFTAAQFSLVLYSTAFRVALPLDVSADALPALDTGPPRSFSFVELVLNESLFAVAPPRLS